jgi:hypothetical protein
MAMAKTNDLRNEADAQYYFGEIKLWYEARRSASVGVVVEAKSDEILYRKLLHATCSFFAVDGWSKSIEVLNLCEKQNIFGILSIIDADLKRVEGYEIPSKNLFLTDYHDKEMMLCHSEAWALVLNSYGDKEKIEKQGEIANKTTIDFLLEVAKPIGVLRLLNQRFELNLKFKTLSNNKYKFIDYQDFIATDDLKLDIENLLKTVENKSSKQGLFKNKPELKTEFDKLNETNFDHKELCNGHDIVNILSIALMSLWANKKSSSKVSETELENSLVLAYRLEDFKKTQLFESLILWEQDNTAFKAQKMA